MEIKIVRSHKKDTYTIGKCLINGVYFSDTIEDTDRGLSDDMNTSTIKKLKVYGKTAIPTGTYTVELTYSNRFHNRKWCKPYKGKCPQIMNVKGFDGVRFHPFNTAEESLGCIAVGRNLKKGMVLNATSYFYKLMDDYILPAVNKGEKISLVIE